MTHRLICGFHPSNGTFGIVSHDQRLKLFSTLTAQLTQDLTEPQHLTQQITAIAFPSNTANKASSLVALGTKSGDIVIWNTKKGEIEARVAASDKHQAAVTSLAFHSNGTFLFSAANDKSVKQWNVSNGAFVASFRTEESHSFQRIATSPDGNLLAAGGAGTLVVWHISSPGAPIRDYQGPTDRICALSFSPDSKYFVSGNSGERYLTVWSAAETEEGQDKKKKKQQKQATTPVHTFTLPHAPISVQFNTFVQSKHGYQLAALSDSSVVSVLQWSPSSAATTSNSSTPLSVITIPASTSQSEAAKRRDHAYNAMGKNKQKSTAASSTLLAGDEGDALGQGLIQAIAFESDRKLLVARGDAVRPQFTPVEFKKGSDSEQKFESEIVLEKYAPNLLMNGANSSAANNAAESKKRKAGNAASNDAVTLGALHAGETNVQARSALDGEEAPNKKLKLANTKSKSDALSLSLAERLAESEKASALLPGGAAIPFDLEKGQLPKAGSLQTILQQALHSNDVTLVEYCLTAGATHSASNSNLIRSTVKRLGSPYILPLLQHLMSKFSSRPNRSAQLLPWLREIFKTHTTYLLRQPNLTQKLAPLYHLLDARLSVFKKLLKLQGRLELLLSQISNQRNSAQLEAEDEAAAQGPLNTFNDGEADEDEDDEEDEDREDDDEDEDEEEDEEEMDEEDDGEGEEDDDEEDEDEDEEDMDEDEE